MKELQVKRQSLSDSRIVNDSRVIENIDAADGQIVVQVKRFGFSANNITYGVTGDQLGYWQFFPCANAPGEDQSDEWGLLPVWGFADIVSSSVAELPVGERLFGYFPPAEYLVMKPDAVTAYRLSDGSAHRAHLPPGYNNYRRVSKEPHYSEAIENEMMLLYPLYVTSFSLYTNLTSNAWFDAEQIVIVSASSKTSIGLAYGLSQDQSAPRVVGLTSARNHAFVNDLGYYDETIDYDNISAIDAGVATTIVDMSGSSNILGQLHEHLGDNLKRCINVGITHRTALGTDNRINKERSAFFFAPDYIQQCMKEWGAAEFQQKSSAYLAKATVASKSWLQLRELKGLTGLESVLSDVADGLLPPQEGLVILM